MFFTVDEINEVLGLVKNWQDGDQFSGFPTVCIDSRLIKQNQLFLALKGQNFDGHNFIEEAISKGAKALVVSKKEESLVPINFPYWAVQDTKEALQKLALCKRRKLRIPVIAITGSVGKTTTKEMVGHLLKSYGNLAISKLNNNNEIGVSLTILSATRKDKLIILEMGMRGIGQIEKLSKFSEPDIAVITNIGTSHIGLLGSKEKIAEAKCEITKYLNPTGLLIIPSGDQLLEKTLINKWQGRLIKVQLSDIKAIKNVKNSKKDFIEGFYKEDDNSLVIDDKYFLITFLGIHNAKNFLFAYAISKEFNIKFEKYNNLKFVSSNGRNKIIETNKITIMDESYNSSPESLKACIEVLLKYPNKHYAVLGSMKELGKRSYEYHKEVLHFINQSDIQGCIFVCDKEEENTFLQLNLDKEKFIFLNGLQKVSSIINKWTRKNDYLLIKGSRVWQLEKIIPYID